MNHYPHPEGVKIDNLLRMADYIENVPEDKFSMTLYRSESHHVHACHSIGCIIGHCTILDDFENIPYCMFSPHIDFDEWCYRFTGISQFTHSKHWRYLFDQNWANTDNTTKGAAKRIRYYIENGLPENWHLQISGIEPLSYNQ